MKRYEAVLEQAEDNLWVRIRQRGHKPQSFPVTSYEEAGDLIETLRQEHKRGLFIDYRKAHLVTGAGLMQQYLETEVPKHKTTTRDYETVMIRGWIEDSQNLLAKRIAEHNRATDAGETPEPIKARRVPRDCLEWLQKPFAAIETTDIESYIVSRVDDDLKGSTVDREIDVWAQVCHWAVDVLKIHVKSNPMTGVRRPRYFNERNRRLNDDEKARLFEAARAEDRAQSPEFYMQHRLQSVRVEARTVAKPDGPEAAHRGGTSAHRCGNRRRVPAYSDVRGVTHVLPDLRGEARRGSEAALVPSRPQRADRTLHGDEERDQSNRSDRYRGNPPARTVAALY